MNIEFDDLEIEVIKVHDKIQFCDQDYVSKGELNITLIANGIQYDIVSTANCSFSLSSVEHGDHFSPTTTTATHDIELNYLEFYNDEEECIPIYHTPFKESHVIKLVEYYLL